MKYKMHAQFGVVERVQHDERSAADRVDRKAERGMRPLDIGMRREDEFDRLAHPVAFCGDDGGAKM